MNANIILLVYFIIISAWGAKYNQPEAMKKVLKIQHE